MKTTTESLGIALPDREGQDDDSISREKISLALQTEFAAMAISMEKLESHPKFRQRLVVRACDRLVNHNDIPEALLLAEARSPERDRLRLLSQILVYTDDNRRLDAVLKAYENGHKQSLTEQLFVIRQKVVVPVLIRPRDHRVFGPPLAHIDRQLKALPAGLGEQAMLDRKIDKLIALRNIPASEAETFRDHVKWGWTMSFYLRFLSRYALGATLRDTTYSGKALKVHTRIMELYNQASSWLPVVDLSRLEADRDAGRSILIASAHAGSNGFIDGALELLEMKKIYIAASIQAHHPVENGPEFIAISTKGGAQFAFLKAMRAVRKSPYQIRVFPDGPYGQERIHGSVLGKPADIGAGAGVLGWQSQANTYFAQTRWRDDGRLDLVLEPGPDARDYDNGDAFQNAFNAFYFDRLNDIANGSPKDMTCGGGLWNNFLKE